LITGRLRLSPQASLSEFAALFRRSALLAYNALEDTCENSHINIRKNMSLVTIVITLIVVGVLLWLVNTYIPMDGKIKRILNIVVVVVVVLWLLNVFGVMDHLRNVRASTQSPYLGASTYGLASQTGPAGIPAALIGS
jgi:hypothetical protein